MRVLVCGSRDWDDPQPIRGRLAALPRDAVVIHGAARGADRIAGLTALVLGHEVEAYPADWDRYGRAAGPLRNARMLREGKPDLVIAFFSNKLSRGTRNMVELALAARCAVELYGDPPLDLVERADRRTPDHVFVQL